MSVRRIKDPEGRETHTPDRIKRSRQTKMLRAVAILLMLAQGAVVSAQDGQARAQWRLDQAPERLEPVDRFIPTPNAFDALAELAERPRLSVSLAPQGGPVRPPVAPALSWSLEAWQMNTASLAHIQCSRATRTLQAFVVENCRFVDRPLPRDSTNLVQVRGTWMAAPGIGLNAAAFSGRKSILDSAGLPLAGLNPALAAALPAEQVDGVNVNVSFGLEMGQVGDLLLDLQLERFRERTLPLESAFAQVEGGLGLQPRSAGAPEYRSGGQLSLGWRGQRFSADLTGEYQELPFWAGSEMQGAGFRSFDLEFSWRSPLSSSISIGVSNVLDRLPGEAVYATDRHMEETVDGIFGRIPYVRYKHDL